MRRLSQLIWKEYIESRGLLLGFLVLMILSLVPGFINFHYMHIEHITPSVIFQIFSLMGFSFLFGVFAWGHEFESKAHIFLEALPLKQVTITRAKYSYYILLIIGLFLFIISINWHNVAIFKFRNKVRFFYEFYYDFLNGGFPIVVFIALGVMLGVFSYSYIMAYCLRRVLSSLIGSLLSIPLILLLLYTAFTWLVSVFWPLWPAGWIADRSHLNIVNIPLFLIVLSSMIVFLPRKRRHVLLMFVVLIPSTYLFFNLSLYHWRGNVWQENYDGTYWLPDLWNDTWIDRPKDYFKGEKWAPSLINADGIYLKICSSGILEINPNQKTADLKLTPFPFNRGAYYFDNYSENFFSADGSWAVFNSWAPNRPWQFLKRMSCYWVWERQTNRCIPLLDPCGFRVWLDTNKAVLCGDDHLILLTLRASEPSVRPIPLSSQLRPVAYLQSKELVLFQERQLVRQKGRSGPQGWSWGTVFSYNLKTRAVDTFYLPETVSPQAHLHHFVLDQQDVLVNSSGKSIGPARKLDIPLPDTETIAWIKVIQEQDHHNQSKDTTVLVLSNQNEEAYFLRLFSVDFKQVLFEWQSPHGFITRVSPTEEHILMISKKKIAGTRPEMIDQAASSASYTLNLLDLTDLHFTEICSMNYLDYQSPVLKWAPDGRHWIVTYMIPGSTSTSQCKLYSTQTGNLIDSKIMDQQEIVSFDWCSPDSLVVLTKAQEIVLLNITTGRKEYLPLTIVPLFQEYREKS